jgi:hypothetical protein
MKLIAPASAATLAGVATALVTTALSGPAQAADCELICRSPGGEYLITHDIGAPFAVIDPARLAVHQKVIAVIRNDTNIWWSLILRGTKRPQCCACRPTSTMTSFLSESWHKPMPAAAVEPPHLHQACTSRRHGAGGRTRQNRHRPRAVTQDPVRLAACPDYPFLNQQKAF